MWVKNTGYVKKNGLVKETCRAVVPVGVFHLFDPLPGGLESPSSSKDISSSPSIASNIASKSGKRLGERKISPRSRSKLIEKPKTKDVNCVCVCFFGGFRVVLVNFALFGMVCLELWDV